MGLSTLCFDASAPLKLPPLPASFIECSFPEDLTITDVCFSGKKFEAESSLLTKDQDCWYLPARVICCWLRTPNYTSKPDGNCPLKAKVETEERGVDAHPTNAPLPFGDSPLFQAQILSGRTLTSGDDVKETIELTFDLKHPHSFMPGDSVGIFPCNAENEVCQILEALRLSDVSNAPVKISVKEGSKKKLPLYVPCVTTPKILLSSVLEVRGVLKKTFLRSMSEYTGNTSEKRRLLELCSQEGSSEYDRVVLKGSATLNDILAAFPSCRPPLALLIEHLPRLMPRAYSIASSPLASQTLIKIVFNVVTGANGKIGVCSGWLKKKFVESDDISAVLEKLSVVDSVSCESSVPLYFRKPSKFRVPEDPKTPLILIGPGTGIAPFLGFLEHLKLSLDVIPDSHTTRMVYFGCRYPDRDSIYKEEMTELEKLGLLTNYRVCYSRELSESNAPKYVQDLLYLDKSIVHSLIEANCRIFICGDALNMTKDVDAVILKIIEEISGLGEEDALTKLKELETEGKIVKDVWR